ncbi:MAG: protein translocase subunit SecDF [Bacteroidia bacterium]|nr:protein translocase subunit SecDF [Bacteroidia bacterium]
MQNKGAIRLFAIALALVCLYQLSFTWITKRIEDKARVYSKDDLVKERSYLDSVSGAVVYNLGIRKYTYYECKERELNLGLDLKGGMNVTLEVSVIDLLKALAGNNGNDPKFLKALDNAVKMEKSSTEDFVTLFGKAFKQVDPNARLASVFATLENKDKVNYQSTDDEVMTFIRKETDDAISNSFNILRNRIDRFGVTQPNIQRLGTSGRILVELPGVKDPERVRKLLQGTANLEFWETYENTEVAKSLIDADKRLKEILESKDEKISGDSIKGKDTSLVASGDTSKSDESVLEQLQKSDTLVKDTTASAKQKKGAKDNPLFAVLFPRASQDGKWMPGPAVGISHFKDTSKVNAYFKLKQIRTLFPGDVKFMWSVKPYGKTKEFFELIAIKVPKGDKAPLSGDVVTNARPEFGTTQSAAEVAMSMNGEGAHIWAMLTKQNIGKCIAIVLDNYVYSYPVVQSEITGGRSSITGNFTINEAKDLANVLKSGKLPAPARIVQEEVVGPSLGKESINYGLLSFVIAFILVLFYMFLYYNRAGLVANIALLCNVFFLLGVLVSLGAVLTLPGIAGIVLTMGMAVDANVIIYERIREELRAGKGIKLAVADGYNHAYSAIIDGNVTTILTGIILYIFGSGPVQGFATTLIIGICTSLFSAIFISRLIFTSMLGRNKNISFDNKYTHNILTKVNIDFIGIRKKLYVVSITVIFIGIISLFINGMRWGVDFTGGRTFIVRFDKNVRTDEIRSALKTTITESTEVKTFGGDDQVKITTKYLSDDNSKGVDSIITSKMYQALKGFYTKPVTLEQFSASDQTIGVLSSQKVGPTIADDIKYAAVWAIIFSLVGIFIYIAIRFKKWQYGVGGVVSLFHDSLVVISMYSIFWKIMPFSMEVDQAFIAALLTVIGYSINDTVIIFDRIREWNKLYPKRELKVNMDGAMNSTLGRTLNTSLTTLVTLIAMFILGGEVIRGFIFALLVGIGVGTYSSIFNATPVAYDILMWQERRKAKKKQALQGK